MKNYEEFLLPILILDPGVPVPEAAVQRRRCALALEVNLRAGRFNKPTLEFLITGETPFLLLVDDLQSANQTLISEQVHEYQVPESHTIRPELVEPLALALFSRNYIRHEGIPVVGIRQSDMADVGTVNRTASFLIYLNQQGWPAIQTWRLSSLSFKEQVLSKTPPPLLLTRIDFDENFLEREVFVRRAYAGSHVFIKGSDNLSSLALEEEFSKLCASIIGRDPLYRHFLSGWLYARKEVERLSEEASVLEERLRNAEITIKTIRTKYKEDYDVLFRWYQAEYEVLPLWYKRFGHVIKTFMGKRTFRSLFRRGPQKHI
ncbi:MAG: hypothetical protein Q8927_03175 [Bacteroidota bacterium]|nr:hypothetical protein [Bacteroidota bacterium]MDP4215176.1 hypothetical protein [Bacteroidota bacterium]MDP4252675.1 hypothetical protein [Bacteroidota bacterium]MDP4256698.1 hypothetical protein [Bacteroidota bacterium]